MNYQLCESPLGLLLLVSNGQALKRLEFIDDPEPLSQDSKMRRMTDDVLQETLLQLQEWFSGQRTGFNLPLAPEGTEFQQQVWHQLQQIPYGERRTYSQLAQAMGKPTAARAVGSANSKNPIALIIPCHRVNGAKGALTGYAWGLERKKKLQQLEAEFKATESAYSD